MVAIATSYTTHPFSPTWSPAGRLPREWDFAMKEMESARSYLTSVGAAAGKAGRDLWDQEKAKVGRAWVSTQDAYGKVKSSTTAR